MSTDHKKIACIGWGSLVWDPRDLPVLDTWQTDGPLLPVEFARESGGRPGTRRITLVICSEARRMSTCWALLDAQNVRAARNQLGLREYEHASSRWIDQHVGFWDGTAGTSFGMEAEAIASWAASRGLAGAVWTNLPCGLKASRGTMPGAEDVVAYLRALSAEDRPGAERYVRNAPRQVDTPYRRAIVDAFGWSPE